MYLAACLEEGRTVRDKGVGINLRLIGLNESSVLTSEAFIVKRFKKMLYLVSEGMSLKGFKVGT